MFYGINDKEQKIPQSTLAILGALFGRVFHADQLITVQRCMGFYDDKKFVSSMDKCAQTSQDRSLAWRLHTQAWAAGQCRQLKGDFVECGVYKGFCSDFIINYLDLAESGKQFYLFDTFDGIPEDQRAGSPVRPGDYAEEGLYEQALERFEPYGNVSVVKGRVPEVFEETRPEQISYLHLDMNSAAAEVGALEVLFSRIVPGGMIVLDDYGWYSYRAQKEAEDPFFAERGYEVLELPTGQGLVVKHP